MNTVQVDKGAIKFILSGADIMCPGLTSPGASLPTDLPKEAIVVSIAKLMHDSATDNLFM